MRLGLKELKPLLDPARKDRLLLEGVAAEKQLEAVRERWW